MTLFIHSFTTSFPSVFLFFFFLCVSPSFLLFFSLVLCDCPALDALLVDGLTRCVRSTVVALLSLLFLSLLSFYVDALLDAESAQGLQITTRKFFPCASFRAVS